MSTGNLALWNDIKKLYNNLNEVRSKFELNTITPPENKGISVVPTDVKNLKDLVEAMTTNSYIGSIASTSEVIVPVKGEKLIEEPFLKLDEIIANVREVCNYNSNATFDSSTFNGTSFGNSSCFGSSFGGCSFNASAFFSTVRVSFCPSFDSSSFNGSSFNSSSFRSSFNSSCASSCSGGSFRFTGSYR